jgi:hypothetical protein
MRRDVPLDILHLAAHCRNVPVTFTLDIMQTMVVEPRVGVGPIALGSSRVEVLRALVYAQCSFLKVPSSQWPTDSWFSGALQVFYSGEPPRVEFIELSRGSELEALVLGNAVFSIPAREVLSRIPQGTQVLAEEEGSSYVVPELELSFWREGCDDEYFASVGIGMPGYFSRERAHV